MVFHGKRVHISHPFYLLSQQSFFPAYLQLSQSLFPSLLPSEIFLLFVLPWWNFESSSFNSPLDQPLWCVHGCCNHPPPPGNRSVSTSLCYRGCTLQSFYIMHCPALWCQFLHHWNISILKLNHLPFHVYGRLRTAPYNLFLFSI